MIGRRLPASSSFVLAGALPGAPGCGRSSWTPAARRHRTRQLRGSQQPAPPARRPQGHRARPPRALDRTGLHGWAVCWPWNAGKMDGFVTSAQEITPEADPATGMGYWTEEDLPFYYGLARTFPI